MTAKVIFFYEIDNLFFLIILRECGVKTNPLPHNPKRLNVYSNSDVSTMKYRSRRDVACRAPMSFS